MTDNRSHPERRRDSRKEEHGYAVATAAAAAKLVAGLDNNSLALATLFGIRTPHFDPADEAFDEVRQLQPEVAERIARCEGLDPRVRADLARSVRTADLLADPAASFAAVLDRVRREAIRRHPSAGHLDAFLKTTQPAAAIAMLVSLTPGLSRAAKDRLGALIARSDRAGFAAALLDVVLEGEPELRRLDSELQRLIERAKASRRA